MVKFVGFGSGALTTQFTGPNRCAVGPVISIVRRQKGLIVPRSRPSTATDDTLAAWSSIPRLLRKSVAGLSERQLNHRYGAEGWSIREYVHHLIEANIIASTIVIAALGKAGSVYDWSWVQPQGEWVKRLGYNKVALEPGFALLTAVCRYVVLLICAARRGTKAHVYLKDSATGSLEKRTVEQVLREEWEHAQHHLHEIAEARRAGATQE